MTTRVAKPLLVILVGAHAWQSSTTMTTVQRATIENDT
jgi:hypothetical protein